MKGKHIDKAAACCLFISLLFVFVGVSCNGDEKVATLMKPQEMCGYSIYSENASVKWNGEEIDKCDFNFAPIKGDTTKLLMKLYDIIPANEGVNIIVDVVPGESNIQFFGKAQDYRYKLEVNGTFVKSAGTKGANASKDVFVDMQCKYEVTSGVKPETACVFRFDKNCMLLSGGRMETIEWEGQTYTESDFVKTVVGRICERTSREVAAMKFVFHKDSYLDIFLQAAGSQEFTLWMTVRYWFDESMHSRFMYFEFTDEQMETFLKQWSGFPEIYTTPFDCYRANRNLLPILYWPNDQWVMTLADPGMYHFISMYVNAKGSEGLSEKEQQELFLFRDIIKKDQGDGSWSIILLSEFVEKAY